MVKGGERRNRAETEVNVVGVYGIGRDRKAGAESMKARNW